MLAKIKETTKASDDEIGRNLMGLARARPDVFGESILRSHAQGSQQCVAEVSSLIRHVLGSNGRIASWLMRQSWDFAMVR